MPDLAEVGVIFEAEIEILVELMRKADGGREVRETVMTRCKIDDRIDDEFEISVAHPDDRPQFDAKTRRRKHCRIIAELEIGTVEEIALLGVGRDEQRAQLHALREERPVLLQGEGRVKSEFPPWSHAISEFRRAVEAVIGDEAARMIRLLQAIPDIIEMLLHSPLAWLGDFGVIDLNFVDSSRPLRRKNENRRSPQPGDPFSKVAIHKSRIPALIDIRRICLFRRSDCRLRAILAISTPCRSSRPTKNPTDTGRGAHCRAHCLAPVNYIQYSGFIDEIKTIAAFAALAQTPRLDTFRLLVAREPDGVPAGEHARLLGVPRKTH